MTADGHTRRSARVRAADACISSTCRLIGAPATQSAATARRSATSRPRHALAQLRGEARGEGAAAADLGEIEPFAEKLVRGVREHLGEIDAQIQGASQNWRLERMARVDRNLLRLALYELQVRRRRAGKVAINEAIEIAKRYGTAESPAFVNGILDRCSRGAREE